VSAGTPVLNRRVFRTIRFRLTAGYSLLLSGLAALAVGGIYLAVASTVDAEPLQAVRVQQGYQLPNGKIVTTGEQFELADLASVQEAVNYQTLQALQRYSLVGLAGLFVASIVISWWLSGRALRPVRRITATTKEITATDLSRRIALEGPADELRDLSETIDNMLDRLDRAFAAQRQLIDDASHELRNPLAVIQANVEAVLSRDDVSTEERDQATQVVGRATRRMTRLVEDLLASAQRSATELADTDVDLAEVADEAGEEYELLAGDRGLRLARRLGVGLVTVGDPDGIRRAVLNLLSNAVRLAPEGTEVVLGAGQERGWCWVAVRDDGPGIAEQDQERVFDRFWRGSRTDADGRTGLGLSIVRQVVESHGGSIALHSASGVGSCFVLWFPARTDPASPTGGRSLRPPATDPLPRTLSGAPSV
jgi:signal transduction histidine kinase